MMTGPANKRAIGSAKLKLLERAACDRELTTGTDYKVLVMACHWADEDGVFCKTVDYIAAAVGRDRSNIIRSMRRLSSRGYLNPRGRTGKSGQVANAYQLNFTLPLAMKGAITEARRAAKAKKKAANESRKNATLKGAKSRLSQSQDCDPCNPYSSPISSLENGDLNAPARAANEGSGRSLGDILGNRRSGGEVGRHSDGVREGVAGEPNDSKAVILEAKAKLKARGMSLNEIASLERRERVRHRPLERQAAFWRKKVDELAVAGFGKSYAPGGVQ